MENTTLSGLLLIILAGTFSGIFAIPFKKNKKWEWENNWFIWSIVALIVGPWIAALSTIPALGTVLGSSPESLIMVTLFGLIWGFGSILFGKGINYLGVSLALPVMLGLINVIGTLTPVLLRDPRELISPAGIRIIVAVLVILAGIILFSIAGNIKNSSSDQLKEKRLKSKFRTGLMISLAAGIFGPMINFAFVYGEPLQEKAIEMGASQLNAANAIWCVALSAGFIVNIFECIRLFRVNKTWRNFSVEKLRVPVIYATIAGVLWYLSIMFYGMGGSFMGKFASSIGWAVMQSMAIITGNVSGIISGEWKGASHNAFVFMIFGMLSLIAGIVILAFG